MIDYASGFKLDKQIDECIRRIIGSSLFQIFRRFFQRKVWLLIIVPYVSESTKMPVPSRYFGLGAWDIIIASSEPQKLFFLLWAQSKVMETIANDIFSWGTTKTTFSIKIGNSVTPSNSECRLVTCQTSKTHFCGLASRPRHENALKQYFSKWT